MIIVFDKMIYVFRAVALIGKNAKKIGTLPNNISNNVKVWEKWPLYIIGKMKFKIMDIMKHM